MKKILILLVLFFLSFSLRLYRINNPLADWHSFRQADTASVTREFVKHGINWLYPKYHDLSNIQSGKDNPDGFRMVEFPLLNGLTAQVIRTFNLQGREVLVGRLASVVFSSLTTITIFLLAEALFGFGPALLASLFFAVNPYSIYYGRVVLPEPFMLFSITLSLLMQIKRRYLLSALSFAISLLIKPYAIFLLPLILSVPFLLHRHREESRQQSWTTWRSILLLFLIFSLSLIPLYLWRDWIKQFPSGIPASDWLYNKDNIRLRPAFFHWLFEVRIGTFILGLGLIPAAIFGLITKGKNLLFLLVYWTCLFLYLIIFAGGNVQHDYYQVFLLPAISLTVGRGLDAMFKLPAELAHKKLSIFIVITLIFWSLFVSWYNIRGYFQVNNGSILPAGEAVDKLTPLDAKVIAPYNGDTAFLFATNRTGWPIGYYIEDKIKLGATHYVSVVNDYEANDLAKIYKVILKNDQFVLIDLTQKK